MYAGKYVPSLQEQPSIVWDKKYARKKNEKTHNLEDQRLLELEFSEQGCESLVTLFLRSQQLPLDPPDDIQYAALREFLLSGNVGALNPSVRSTRKSVLLDDRRDPNGSPGSTRVWDDDGPEGYMSRPTTGEVSSIYQSCLTTPEFIGRVNGQKRHSCGAEKRTIYIPNLDPTTALALVATVAYRTAPMLRRFLDYHVRYQEYLGVSMGSTFNLEFHIPFFALRRGPPRCEERIFHGQPLRAWQQLPLGRNADERNHYYFEGHVSFLITGVDEWFWTAYCCVDTYFGAEVDWETYPEGPYGYDGPTGKKIWQRYPCWNPREYFLLVLSYRMMQATAEWRTIINAFQERLVCYEKTMLFSFFDDAQLRRTEELTLVVFTLRCFRDSLFRIIGAWEVFERRDIRYFEVQGTHALQQTWQSYIDITQAQISELKALHILMVQKLELFNSMRDGLVNASSLRESAASTRQGKDIGLLTRMTVIYLPLTLATSIFGISMLPDTSWLWAVYGLTLMITLSTTVYVARHPYLLSMAFKAEDKAQE